VTPPFEKSWLCPLHSITFVIAGKEHLIILERALTTVHKCGNYREVNVIWSQRTPPIEASKTNRK